MAETWRLDKYAVEFLGPDSDRYVAVRRFLGRRLTPILCAPDSPLSCNVDEILATEMLEHAQSLGVRKFRLSDEVTGEEQMAVGGTDGFVS